MNSLHKLCTPRKSVFDPQKRDTVLDLTDLVDDRIDAEEFFTENFITEGKTRLKTASEFGGGCSPAGLRFLEGPAGCVCRTRSHGRKRLSTD